MRYLCLCCCMCTCTDKLLFKERTTWQLAFTFGPSSAAHLLASTAERQRRGLARTRSLLSGMCSSTQTNLAHWLCQTHRERQDINPLFWRTSSLDYLPVVWHNSCLLQSIMRVFTWADQKISSLFFLLLLVKEDCFTSQHDFNAKFSNDEQKRNGDKNPHEDKSWPVHSQLRVGRQRAGQVSFVCCMNAFPAVTDGNLICACAVFALVLVEQCPIISCKSGNHIRFAFCTC